MTNQELIRLLKANSYKRIALDNDTGEPKTFYTYRRGLHINATDKLSFHIVPQSQSLGLGRFAICATGNGASSQWVRTVLNCFSHACCHTSKVKQAGKKSSGT